MNKPRIYISAPVDAHLTHDQRALKAALLGSIISWGFEPQIFHESGIPANKAWAFQDANDLMSRCDGAAVLAFAKWRAASAFGGEVADLPSEYNHFEGALAVAHNVPLLLVTDRTVRTAGITYLGGGLRVHFWPEDRGPDWIDSPEFRQYFQAWANEVESRRKVFLGYCSGAKPTADAVTLYMERELKVKVLNYSMDFRPGLSIFEQIEEAARQSTCGVFLFTKDDEMAGATGQAAPRDNVIFEAGYFARAKGRERLAIIREEGAKMPADLGGIVYISLKNRDDIAPIETQVRRFLESQL